MNKHFLSLELDKILALVAELAFSDECKDKIISIVPITDYDKVVSEVDKTDEAFVLSAKFGSPDFTAITSIKALIERAKSGSVLSLKELIDVRTVLNSTSRIASWYIQTEGASKLKYLFNQLSCLKDLQKLLCSAIISETELADDASPELSSIRRSIISKDNQIRDKLSKMIRSSEVQKKLQESIITMRDGRFVIPVKAENKNDVSGLIHDTSASGSTFFIEPMSVVELNNEIRVLQAKEQAEIERIMKNMSELCGEQSATILLNYDVLIKLEFYFTKANFAFKTNSCKPVINNKAQINLIKARHPLIAKDKIVPVDIKIGYENTVMIITGPNTGGKTVALKTTGLLVAMIMCGFLIPVSSQSEISVFDNILVDIGDEQSIENDLSTFSSHMTNIVDILKTATTSSLILLDEIGSGTDPAEGAALAISIISYLKGLNCRILAATHYQELKLYAINECGIINASCEFDVENLKPTYKLIVGVPGKSNAFAISKKLGLDDFIIDNAKDIMQNDDKSFENAVKVLEKVRVELENEKNEMLTDRLKAKAIREKLEIKQKEIDRITNDEIKNAKQTASRLLDSLKLQSNQILEELEIMRKNKEKDDFVKKELELKSSLSKKIDSIQYAIEDTDVPENNDYVLPRKLRIGDSVTMRGNTNNGTVKSIVSDIAVVQFGMISMKVKISDLMLHESAKINKKLVKSNVTKSVTKTSERDIRQEFDVRGLTVDEAIMEVDRYIDGCIMSGIHSFTIIHGKGTGALRSAIHQYLKRHSNVRTFRLGVYGEGESGVTIVDMK